MARAVEALQGLGTAKDNHSPAYQPRLPRATLVTLMVWVPAVTMVRIVFIRGLCRYDPDAADFKHSGLAHTLPGPGHTAPERAIPVAASAGDQASASSFAAPPAPQVSSRPVRRRMRKIWSCLECRRRKTGCDKQDPCSNCVKYKRQCVHIAPQLDEAGQLRLTLIKDKVGFLERQLERDVAHEGSAARRQQRIIANDIEEEYDETSKLEPTDLASSDITYEDSGAIDDLIDLGVRVGRMRVTERIGGLSRPRIAEEVS